ncbi:hypothetical protein HPULCUR_003464 [Helicostylum pulchrum]|uniref:Uncharacterized protein n=1 Tax=Helicostylum pulchrum TaxID=562976 RepID=A0ABP9XUT9_9FUNG
MLTNTFNNDGDKVSLTASDGFDIWQLLSTAFGKKAEMDPVLSIRPLPDDTSDAFKKDFDLLFTGQHLHLMFAHYSGEKGNKKTSLEEHPKENALFEELPLSDIAGSFEIPALLSEQKMNVITSAVTNVENMWGDNKKFSKLLDSTLNVLLRLHLAPTRTTNNKSYKKKQEEANNTEKKESYEQAIVKNKARTNHFKNLKVKRPAPSENVVTSKIESNEEGKSGDSLTKDTSRIRLKSLKSVSKHLLFSSEERITEQLVKTELGGASEEEVAVVMLLTQTLQQYMSKKSERYVILHQLPFCILVNDILNATGYTKFTRKLFLKPTLASLQSLELNATSLYQMLTAKPDLLILADFDNKTIDSIDYARSNKDATFCAIFGLDAVTKICKSYNLEFAQRITIHPGMKTVRLLGSKKDTNNEVPETSKDSSYSSRFMKHPSVIGESKKEVDVLRQEISSSDNQLLPLQEKLKELLKEQISDDDPVRLNSKNNGVLKAGNRRLYESDNQSFSFSGTDNGVVNLSAIAPFTMERYKFHLNLYNRYEVLKDGDDIKPDQSDKQYLTLPNVNVIKSAEIDVGCGYRKSIKTMLRRKKYTTEGRLVLEAEKFLSDSSLKNASTVSLLLERVKLQ